MNKSILALLCLLAADPLRAAIVLNETFSYANGNLVGASGSPWANHSGSGSFIQVSDGAIRIVHGSGSREDANAPLSGAPYSTNGPAVLYSSFNVTFTGLPSTNGAYFAHFRDTGLGFRGRVWATVTNTPVGQYRFSIANGGLGGAIDAQYPLDLSTGTTYKVVTRLQVSNAVATLWINPVDETDFSVTGTDPTTNTAAPVNISTYAFRQDQGGGTCLIDDLKVGTTFLDVTSANNPPTITSIPTQNIAANTSAGPLNFTVGDAETPAASLTVGGQSSNQSLIPDASVTFGGAGANRNVTVTPLSGQEGTATVTISVTDLDGATTPTSFLVTVGLPTLSAVADQIIVTNTSTGPIPFTIGDAETPGSLNVSATSSNTTLVPNGNIVLGGSGASRTITITPVTDAAGITAIALSVNDGTHTVTRTFTVTVGPLLGVLIDELFSYADGTAIAGGSTPWINHSGPFGQTLVNGGKVFLSNTNDEDFNREFFPSVFYPSNGIVLYASFRVNFVTLPTTAGNYFAHYKDDGTLNFRGRVFATRATAPAGALRLGVTSVAASPLTNLLHPTAILTNTTHTVVTRYNASSGQSVLWIDPVNESSPSVSNGDAPSPINVYSFAYRQADGMGTLCMDDLKIGTSWLDVIGPGLTITAVGNNVTLSWPAAATGYVLRFTDVIPASWADFGDQGTVMGSQKVVTLNGVSGNRFFRLEKP